MRMRAWYDLRVAFATLFTLGSAAVLSACAPVSFLNSITPSSSFEGVQNISFGDLDRQKLDIYRAQSPDAALPVLVFVHGGGWDSGSKDIYKFFAEGLTSEGFDVVVPNYRLYPNGIYPQFLEDNAKAVAWAAREYADRPIVLIGHSAGAYNIMMLTMRDAFLSEAGVDRCSRLAGAVGLAGPYGFTPLDEEPYITIFPDRFTKDDAVIHNVNGPAPAVFLMNGAEDTTVHPQNVPALAEKIRARGGIAEAKIYEGLNHTEPVKVFSRYFDEDAPVKSDIINFIKSLDLGADNFCH